MATIDADATELETILEDPVEIHNLNQAMNSQLPTEHNMAKEKHRISKCGLRKRWCLYLAILSLTLSFFGFLAINELGRSWPKKYRDASNMLALTAPLVVGLVFFIRKNRKGYFCTPKLQESI